MFKNTFKSGQTLIELLIAIGLAAVLLPALVSGIAAARQGKPQQAQRLAAIGLLKEAEEAVRATRNNDWANVQTNGTYHPVVSGNTWILQGSAETTTSGYGRSITISDVQRDDSGLISITGIHPDPSVKKIDIAVTWSTPFATSVNATEYLSRFQNNTVFAGNGTAQPPAGGHGDWCAPNLSITALDLPKNGVANAISAIEGRVFAGTGENSSGVSFANVTISNARPPISSVVGTFNGFKTNGVFGETNYAYLATDNNSKEIEIIDLTQIAGGKYSEAGYFDAPGNGNGGSIFVSGNIGYMTTGSTLYTFDLSSKSGSRAKLGSVSLAGGGNKVSVVGNYAYVAESGSTQLQIIQVSPDGKTLSVVGQAQVSGLAGIDVSLNLAATRAYLATAASSSQRELFVIDISTKTGNRPTVGSYEANGMSPKGVTVVPPPENRVILVGTAAEEYQVIKIKDDAGNEITPVRCGGLNIDTGIKGVSSVLELDGDVYSYIVTGDSSTELKIIEGGIGTGGSGNGIFESSTFDAGHNVAFNYFSATSNPSLTYKLAIKQAVGGVCPTFVDSDFVAISTGPITLPGVGYSNPGQCLRYRVINSGSTAVPYTITINYSP